MEYEEERETFEGKTAMEKIEILQDAYLTKLPQKKNVLKNATTANYAGGDYSKFKLNYMKEHYEKMHALDKVERNRIIKAAYEKQHKKMREETLQWLQQFLGQMEKTMKRN